MEIITFIAQWTLILQLMWISCVLIPFTLLAIVFFVLNWLILDPFTNWLITGNFNTSIITSQITLQSPIVIITWIALVLALIALIVFIINYFVKNTTNLQLIHIPKQLLMIFSFIGIVILIPFGIIFMSVFTKFLTSITLSLFSNNSSLDLLNLEKFKITLQNLLNFSSNSLINNEVWDNVWGSIVDPNQLAIKDSLFNNYNSIIHSLNNFQMTNLINELLQNTNDLNKIKQILNQNPNLANNLNLLINQVKNFENQLINLNSLSISNEILEKIKLNFGSLNSINHIQIFNLNIANLLKYVITLDNVLINTNGQLIQTNNIAFILYYATTGLYVNSIEGIITNFTFLQGLFQANGIFELAKSIFLSGIIAIGITKAVMTLINMLIYRWFALVAGIPSGYLAAARITNDSYQIIKIWFREILTCLISLFVICLNLQMMYFLINSINIGLNNKQIAIVGINNINFLGTEINIIQITFALFIVCIIYVNNSFIAKILETFNASATFKDNVSSSIVNEYNSAKNLRKNNKKSISNYKKSITKNDRYKNWKKSGFSKQGFKESFAKFKFIPKQKDEQD